MTSPTLDALSDGAERMFWRLTLVADDYGRFEADPRVLLAKCFPLWVGQMKVEWVTKRWIELVEIGLTKPYRIGEKQFGYFPTWDKYQRVRSRHSKFPAPPDGGGAFQSLGDLRAVSNETRNTVLLRDKQCLGCGSERNLVMDHIVPVVSGGGPEFENLQTLCQTCNSAKRDRTINLVEPDQEASEFIHVRSRLRVAAMRGDSRRNAPEKRGVENRETRDEESAPAGAPSPVISFLIPDSISKALDKCEHFVRIPKLRDASFWQAMVRAYRGVDFGRELFDAESWIIANPKRAPKADVPAFLRRWFSKAHAEVLV